MFGRTRESKDETLKKILLRDLREAKLDFSHFCRVKGPLVREFHSNSKISDEELDDALEVLVLDRGEHYLKVNVEYNMRSWRRFAEDIAYFISNSSIPKKIEEQFKRKTRLSVDDFATAFFDEHLVENCKRDLLQNSTDKLTPEYQFLERIGTLNPYELVDFGRDNKKEVELWVEKIGVDKIRGAVNAAVIREAKRDYKHVILDRAYPDHLGYDLAFSYAIFTGIITPKQVALIHFDGETAAKYCSRKGGKNLVDDLTEGLLNPPPKPEYKSRDSDPHPCCDH